jgi:hemolysin III
MSSTGSIRFNKQPVAWATHFAGFLGALVGTVALLQHAGEHPSAHPAKYASLATYGVALMMVFGSSSLYHFFDIGEWGNRWLRRLDHCAIFALILGSYAPFIVHLQEGSWRIVVLTVVVVLCLGGMVFKIAWIDCPDLLGAGIYLGLAWLAVIPAVGWLPQLSSEAIALLVSGGLAFTVGAVVYVKEWPDPWPKVFGHHEIWHIFVLAGAGAHYFFMWSLVPYEVPPF